MIEEIEARVLAGERLSFDDGVALFAAGDVHALGRLANLVRERRHGGRATYIRNMHLNYSNVCIFSCDFCAFARKPGQEGGWEMSVDEAVRYAERQGLDRLREVHIVGGVHPKLPYVYYIDLLRALRARFPHAHLKAFTAIEIEHLSRIGRRPTAQVLEDLRDAGLDSLPGGGAEIFARRVWDAICSGKSTPERWLDIHRAAHRLGLRSTCTMLYGHIETPEERVEHMLRLRDLQDETGGFTAFIPLAFQAERTRMADVPEPTAHTDLKVHAVARLLLDNIDHIKAYWIMTGLPMAQLLLSYGADDLDGTIVEERIAHMAEAESPVGVTEDRLRALIREAGREPVERDSLYATA